jgi:hypothetical protein
MINYSTRKIREMSALNKLNKLKYHSRINLKCFNKLPNLKKKHENFIKSINSSENINKNINKKYSNLKKETEDFYSKYQLKYSNN